MELTGLTQNHLEEAGKLFLSNLEEERQAAPFLPKDAPLPDLSEFCNNGLGVALTEQGKLLGYLGCYAPWENAFTTTAKGTFSPIHAHGAAVENREKIYALLYQKAARLWVREGIASHSIGLFFHDRKALSSFFWNGFGLRCVDAMRPMKSLGLPVTPGYAYRELAGRERERILPLRRGLLEHLSSSPCFMRHPPKEEEKELRESLQGDTRIFAAFHDGKPAAFLELRGEGENFLTEAPSVKNICGAYCLPSHRGNNVMQSLLEQVISVLGAEGYQALGVDFESFNSAGSRFWLKYFTPYTGGVVRRIDENVFRFSPDSVIR